MDPPGPVPGHGDHQMLADLDAESLAALVAAVGAESETPERPSPLLSFELRHLGGALGRRDEGSGALGALDARYMTFGVGMLPAPELLAPLEEALARGREALDVVDSGGSYGNFAESAVDAGAIYGPRTLARLREVKAAVDPDGVLLANHQIDAATAA
jgi:hypothetical protein